MNVDYAEVKSRKEVELEMRLKRLEGDLKRRGASKEDIEKHLDWVKKNR